MAVTVTSTLQLSELSQIQSMHPAFPYEDAELYAIFEKDGIVCSSAAFFCEGDDIYECYAFTRPEYRRQGLFSELLEQVIEALPEETAFLFYTNGTEPDTMATLQALEAELVQEEHMMELDLNNRETIFPYPDLSLTMTLESLDGTLTRQYQNAYGSVNISIFSSYYYLYGLEIQEPYRSQGHGARLLDQVLSDLATLAPLPLRLQVSGDNIPAVSLYKKTGFQITETLSGYLY